MLVPGLRNTIALDFHLNQSSLYWTDVVEDKIYRGKLLENGGASPQGPLLLGRPGHGAGWGGWMLIMSPLAAPPAHSAPYNDTFLLPAAAHYVGVN